MKTYYLAIDIGASSGRHILGYVENDRLCLEEIYRFDNNIKNENGTLIWDIDNLAIVIIFQMPPFLSLWGGDYRPLSICETILRQCLPPR